MRYRLLRFAGDKCMAVAEADTVHPLYVLMAGYVQDIIKDGGFSEYVILDTETDKVYYRVKMGE